MSEDYTPEELRLAEAEAQREWAEAINDLMGMHEPKEPPIGTLAYKMAHVDELSIRQTISALKYYQDGLPDAAIKVLQTIPDDERAVIGQYIEFLAGRMEMKCTK